MQKKVLHLSFAALFAALITALTSVHLAVLPNGGYVHLGDAFVFLAGCILPTPYAMIAAGFGGVLADLLGGAPMWAPATLLIKALIALLFTAKKETTLNTKNGIALVASAPISCVGYYIAECLIYAGANQAAWRGILAPSLIGNGAQAVASSVLFIAFAFALQKTKVDLRVKKLLQE
ncbi:MAG: TIGR04002 family protein [Oscillospiraceae bacterium]|jgi:uncharacterized repeat protein (TIGR04002 family)|nr:TIGR04002 family protein [Oscillospiraceae bacterium]